MASNQSSGAAATAGPASGQAPDELARLRMLALLSQHLDRPAAINSIEVHGAKNTRIGFLDPLFKPLVASSKDAPQTMGDVMQRLQELSSKLNRFDIFKPEPTVFLSSADPAEPGTAASDLDVAIHVAEKSRFILKTGTDVGNTEGSAYANLLVRNMLGGAESLSVNASLGTRTRSAYSASFATPLNSNPNLLLSLEGLASSTQKPWASYEEVLNGGSLRLAWAIPTSDSDSSSSSSNPPSSHSLAYSGAWRQVTGLAPAASPTVRADAGDSVKSALTYTYTRDRRDNPLLPHAGYLLRTVSELAGWGPLGGDVSFSKSEVELAGALPLAGSGSGVALGAGLRLGLLYPLPFGFSWAGRAQPSRLNDRFQLGGPTDVRGFKLGGLGPRDGLDAVGGDVFAAGGVNLLLPLPRAGPTSPLRLQLFANGGRLVALKNKGKAKGPAGAGGGEDAAEAGMDSGTVMSGMASAIRELGNGLPSLAAGFGLVYAHPVARFELNFSLPLVLRRGEEARKGLQVGVGISFL